MPVRRFDDPQTVRTPDAGCQFRLLFRGGVEPVGFHARDQRRHPDAAQRARRAAAAPSHVVTVHRLGQYDVAARVGVDGLARRIAHITYRSPQELQARFGAAAQGGEDPAAGGRYAVESYLDHHADKLVRRFDAASYVRLTEAMSAHDVGRARGGVSSALSRVRGRTLVAGVDSDRLFPPADQHSLAHGLGTSARIIRSPYGHDGFLIETEQVGALVRELLDNS